jgi:hypothetical protein
VLDLAAATVLFLGCCHYLVGLYIWANWLLHFGIDSDNYVYWLRQALPAFVVFTAYALTLGVGVVRHRTPRKAIAVLMVLTIAHFLIDNRLHHFSLQVMYLNRGCVWYSPTWWWYEHQCGGWLGG